MVRAKKSRQGIKLELAAGEVDLLRSLCEQLVELLTATMGEGQATDSDDPFAAWEAELDAAEDEPTELTDPALKRLFPNPYPHDPQAESDYRRFTEAKLRDDRVAQLQVILDQLGDAEKASSVVVIAEDQTDAWLKGINSLRLTLASRLDITDEVSLSELEQLPDEDPRQFAYTMYEWLGFLLELVVREL
ncbi:DUF2017 domain-containing protein [Parenemella sanctibonifatiensis]|uniref:Uncharacterized protein n=1 Tax=Parenemella sanctibonifatiensis TaxID=2016505 RepID=A0A255E8E4_9ACTN|nr:DUF2017 domain-containing protein [Parenemella sanctibonifatiensis]OYN87847.1 hypothetical protein CGZ92_06190 [Parenemella sanctibonifatiensis]OYN92148.1 hypothetical protein CGZ91_01155 [Parenemella sanctibonifatiensis]